MYRVRNIFVAAILLMIASNLPAPLQPNCDYQPDLRCGMMCTQDGCVLIITPDDRYIHDYCYVMGGTNCAGGTYHKCCE